MREQNENAKEWTYHIRVVANNCVYKKRQD